MADENRFNLLYKPQFGPDKNYRSEATFEEMPLVAPPTTNEPMQDIINGYDQILSFIDRIPEGLREPIEDLLKKLKLRMQIIRYENPPPGVTVYPPGPYNPSVPPNGGEPPWPKFPENPPKKHTKPGSYTPPEPEPFRPTYHTNTYDPKHPGPDVTPPHTTIPKGYPLKPETYDPKYGDVENHPILPPVIGEEPEDPIYIDPSEDIDPSIHIGSDITEEPPTIAGLPSMFPEPTNVAVTVKVPKTLVEIAQDAYRKDQIDLQQYYLAQLQYALQEYFQAMMTIMLETGVGDINMLQKDYDGDVVEIPDANLQHLGDSIERSQVRKNQRARYFRKICNTDQTLQHMRMWHAAEKERERYYAEAYGDSTKYLDSESNALLREARADYDAAYKSGLYNMYRYLDSSIDLTRDVLQANLKESQAKGKLLKEGVDIFKQKEVVTEMHNESESQAHDSTAIIEANKGEKGSSAYDQGEDGTKAANASSSTSNTSGSTSNTSSPTSNTSGSSSSSNGGDNSGISLGNYGKAGTATGGDDSHITAPNGKHYSKNDIEYLTGEHGEKMSQEEAIKILSEDSKYKKVAEFRKGQGTDDSNIKAPNGGNYSNNDINYLTSKGYTKEQALAELAKSETYCLKDKKYYEKIRKQVGQKGGWISAQEYDRTDKKAPNGKWYEKNDVKYLTDQGYTEEQAYAELAKDKKYAKSKSKAFFDSFNKHLGLKS